MNNATQIVVYVSKNFALVELIVHHLKGQDLNAIFSSEANKPYAVKVETTLDQVGVVVDLIEGAITKFS